MILRSSFRSGWRTLATAATSEPIAASAAAAPYPYSNRVLTPAPPPKPTNFDALKKGKGLMSYLRSELVAQEKRNWLETLFSRSHPSRLLPGSVLQVELNHAPTTFTGVLIGLRRRGPDTSFRLRNVVNRTGVEMQFYVNSPHLKSIKVLNIADGRTRKSARRQRRAKLFYLRDAPDKLSTIAGNKNNK